jgi:hypothetical protein
MVRREILMATLAQLVDRLREIEGSDAIDLPFSLAEIAEELERELADPVVLRAVADEIGVAAQELGCSRLVGASDVGERLAGAAVAVGKNGLRPLGPDEHANDVLVVDAVVLTGARLERAFAKLKARGITPRGVAALLASTPAAPDELRVRILVPPG